MTETSPAIPGRLATPAGTSSQPSAVSDEFGGCTLLCAMLLQAPADLSESWDATARWPRADVVPPAAFLALLVSGFAVQSATVALGRRAPLIGPWASFGVFVATATSLDSPAWVQVGSLAIAASVFFTATPDG